MLLHVCSKGEDACRRLRTAAAALSSSYIAAHSRRLSLAVRRSLDAVAWLHAREPRGPRPVVMLFLELLDAASAEATALLGSTGVACT